jgi:demethylmenaquinone methyltransferase/2-methoxy-6-polyprenyl-1,4-benzoquinol methylase/ArsR family transcriptional regulator
MASTQPASFAVALDALEAAGEVTRLRLLALLNDAELTVTELMTILGQSQPRISRHLKLLVEAGLVDRHREGAWAFFRLSEGGPADALVRDVLKGMDENDPVLPADRSRLAEVRRARAEQAARYFSEQARNWDRLRSLHVAEDIVEAAVLEIAGTQPVQSLLDLGTGTGRMLELLAPLAERAIGVDQSPPMLNLARTRLERAGLRNAQLRQGDIYALPVEQESCDLVIVHQVLHYLDDPGRALREAARMLRPGGRLLVIDFAPHSHEFLREQHAHRRLGFAVEEIEGFMKEVGLRDFSHRALAGTRKQHQLTVSLWVGRDARPAQILDQRESA